MIIEYRIASSQQQVTLQLEIDEATVTLKNPHASDLPAWAALEYEQCPNCELRAETTPYCPIAANLTLLLDLCDTLASFETVELEVITRQRKIVGKTTAQRAVTSLLGLIMATSACTHTEFLKPMAFFHLPLASENETIYRTSSMFFLAQYFRNQEGLEAPLNLDGLVELYRNQQTVNLAMAERIRHAFREDATVNAIILLNLLSSAVTWSLEDNLKELKYLFSAYGIKAAEEQSDSV
ncbi:MAG: DUF6901 family protein [Gammaproteobacteria bacterium]